MKTVFINAKYRGKIELNKINLDKLPKRIGIVATVQFLDRIKEVRKYLEENGRKVLVGKDKQNSGQILGCDVGAAKKIQNNVDAFLYIGSGHFHPLGVALNTKKEVFVFTPVSNVFSELNRDEIEKYEKSRKAKYVKFLHAGNVGI